VSLGVRAFQGRWSFGSGERGEGGQEKAARIRCHPWVMATAQRQVASMRNRVWRAPRVMRAATCRTPVAEGVDFAGGEFGVVGEADQLCPGHQIGCRQDDFQPGGVRLGAVTGQLRSPVALSWRMRSSMRACWRWRSSRPASWPGTTPLPVSVRNAVTRSPSESVNRSCAPGCGRSLRRSNRVPVGQLLRSTRSVASATQAPSRMPPPASVAGYQQRPSLRVSVVSRV
jgi:hypothetical protein